MNHRSRSFLSLLVLALATVMACGPVPSEPETDAGTTTEPDGGRTDAGSSQIAALTAIYPATVSAGAAETTLTLVGSRFEAGATVEVNGVSRPTALASASHLTAVLTAADQALAGSFVVRVVNPGSGSAASSGRNLTVVALTLGDLALTTPDWTAATHGKLSAADLTTNLGKVFDETKVQRLDVTIDPQNWAVMRSNLASLTSTLGNSRDYSVLDSPISVPAEVTYEGKQWYRVGVRFKGNSSLFSAHSNKLPFKLKFNEFEDVYPAISGQRFYGFKSFSLKSNFKDESEAHELVAGKLFRDFGLKGPHASFYELYVDVGAGPVYFGLYTLVEEVDDTVLKTQYADASGNLYKPEEGPATFAAGTFGTWGMGKKTNEDALDYTDVQALFDAINADTRTSAHATWKTNLEAIFDVPLFLRWLAANSVMQNWDTYGVMPHNFYLYRNPATQRFEWIPWDSNEALVSNNLCLSLGATEVRSTWPLVRYVLDDPDYAAEYRQDVHEFASTVFTSALMGPAVDSLSALIASSVQREGAGFTFTSPTRFSSAMSALKTQVSRREAAALAY